MPFRYTEQHRIEYERDGLTVLRSLIPVSLLGVLRRETDKAREIARRQHGPQAQRLQPVYAYEELDAQAFRDFLGLPGMQDTVRGILGLAHHPSDIMGVLLEPAHDAWCTAWHRDWGYNAPHVDVEAFFRAVPDLRLFNQLNAALYDDHSLWIVPGSHNREDTPEADDGVDWGGDRAERIRQWQERLAPAARWAPGDPRRWEQRHCELAELTALGRKLLGLDSWDED